MSKKQKTAVEQFWQDLQDILPSSVKIETGIKLLRALKRAKELEKQQIIDAFGNSRILAITNNCSSGEQYYNETFNK
jgi:glutamate 5-kinase